MADRFYDNLQGFSDLKYVDGVLYGRLNGGEYQVIPTEGNPGEDGTDGVNAYLYIAYASDDQGTAFSLIHSDALKYIALLQSTTPIVSPIASMFAGKWHKYLGDDGQDGEAGSDGADGLDAYVYVAYASDASGTAFNMTPSDSLKYRAEIHVTAPIASPSLSDFSGAVWVKYIGDDGQNLVSSVNSQTGAVVLDAEDVGAEASGAVATHNTAAGVHSDLFGAKVDKVSGKGLSTEDYTSDEKTKLSTIAEGAEVNVNADWNATSGDAQILNKPTIPDAQIQADWNQATDTAKDYIKNKPTIPTNSSFTLAGLSEKSYASLTDKPTIPAAQVQPDWSAVSGMGQILNKPSIPSKTSDLTNDSDFITASGVASGYVAKDGSKVLSDNNYDSNSKTKLDNLANITSVSTGLTLTDGVLTANSSGGGSSITWHIIDSNTTATAYHGYFIDASTSAVELTLPESFTLGDTIPVRVIDATNTITIKNNGNNIEGEAEDLVVDVSRSGFHLTASDETSGWLITTEIPTSEIYPNKVVLINNDVVVTVGSGGDYSTINQAITYIKDNVVPNGHYITIRLLTGFVMAEQVLIVRENLNYIKVTSVDAVVPITRSALTVLKYNWVYPAWYVEDGCLPTISALFEMDTTTAVGTCAGIFANSGQALITAGCGVRNVSNGFGLALHNVSTAVATGAIFTGCNVNVVAYVMSRCDFQNGVATGYVTLGVVASTGCILNFYGGNARKAGSNLWSDIGVYDGGGLLIATGATGGLSQTANTLTALGIIFK